MMPTPSVGFEMERKFCLCKPLKTKSAKSNQHSSLGLLKYVTILDIPWNVEVTYV